MSTSEAAELAELLSRAYALSASCWPSLCAEIRSLSTYRRVRRRAGGRNQAVTPKNREAAGYMAWRLHIYQGEKHFVASCSEAFGVCHGASSRGVKTCWRRLWLSVMSAPVWQSQKYVSIVAASMRHLNRLAISRLSIKLPSRHCSYHMPIKSVANAAKWRLAAA